MNKKKMKIVYLKSQKLKSKKYILNIKHIENIFASSASIEEMINES